MNYTIICDYETSERAGAGDMFQVAQLIDQNGVDCTHLVDVGRHYRSFEEVARTIAAKTGIKASDIEFDDD